ncbi:MAG: hypothetical protein RB294_10165 [Bacteroidales bacterium]|jgi:hypothetical protein|nr:hypothetical protein [Bacteroidales bacterium]
MELNNIDGLTAEEILQMAQQNFSNFSGFVSDYTGMGDEFIDFAGSKTQSFSSLEERKFKITITAAAGQSGQIYLTPGLLYNRNQLTYTQDADTKVITAAYPAGYVRDGAFKDTTNTYSFSGVGSPNYIDWFYAYIDRFPMTMHMMRIRSTDATQLEQQIIVEQMNPFYNDRDQVIDPSAFKDENVYQDKISTVPMQNVTLGPDVRISTTIVAGTTTVYSFFLGNALHIRKALEKKQGKAATTMAAKGITPTTTIAAARRGIRTK